MIDSPVEGQEGVDYLWRKPQANIPSVFWTRGWGEEQGFGLGVEKNWVLSQSRNKCLQGSLPLQVPHKEISAEAPEEHPSPRPQIKRPRNDSAGARNENRHRAWLARRVSVPDCTSLPRPLCREWHQAQESSLPP